MGRRPRQDCPGSWHHVINRGIAKRPLFETAADIRFFLSRLAREVRRGRIEVHAYSILTTHFHLLLRSPIGQLSEAMRQAQNAHSRRFNRLRRRDGALIRGRFFSKPVEDDRYWRTLVRYIDHNPVRAGLVSESADYPFGSAYHYCLESGPAWLERCRVEQEACETAGVRRFGPQVYARAFGDHAGDAAELVDLVERRMRARMVSDPLTDLIGSTPIDVQRWMKRKTRLADGHLPGLPVCSPLSIARALDRDEKEHGPWTVERGEVLVPARPRAFIGLAHELAGLSWRELSDQQSESVMRCRRLGQEHRSFVDNDEGYGLRTWSIAQQALALVLSR